MYMYKIHHTNSTKSWFFLILKFSWFFNMSQKHVLLAFCFATPIKILRKKVSLNGHIKQYVSNICLICMYWNKVKPALQDRICQKWSYEAGGLFRQAQILFEYSSVAMVFSCILVLPDKWSLTQVSPYGQKHCLIKYHLLLPCCQRRWI